MNASATQILEQAKAENWKRSQVKDACYAAKIPLAEREAIYAALGMAPTATATISNPSNAQVNVEVKAISRKPRGTMKITWAATDFLTGETLVAGSEAIGVKMGGKWDFTAAAGVDFEQAHKALELLLLSMDADGELDHNDYRDLLHFGERFPYYAARIAVEVPGLGN